MATSVRKFLATVIASVIFNSQLFMISSMPTGDPILIGNAIVSLRYLAQYDLSMENLL